MYRISISVLWRDDRERGIYACTWCKYVPYILENGEYYRLLTSIFLHFGFQHLFNNMVMLLMIGWNLELEMGRVRYVITYFVSGLAGNILSGFLDIRLQDFAISAGASGAIFGITGALLYVVVCNHGRLRDISGRGMFVMIASVCILAFPVQVWIMPHTWED